MTATTIFEQPGKPFIDDTISTITAIDNQRQFGATKRPENTFGAQNHQKENPFKQSEALSEKSSISQFSHFAARTIPASHISSGRGGKFSNQQS